MLTTANLLAEYGLNPSPLFIPAMDAVLTMWPPSPWARMCGRNVRMPCSDAHEVDVEHPSPGVERDVVDAAAAADTGIVADHMDISERLVRRLGRMLEADRIGNVTGNAAHLRPKIAQALDGGGQRVRLDIGEHDLHARLRKGPAEREPDAARAPVTNAVLPASSRMISPAYLSTRPVYLSTQRTHT